MVNRAVLTPLVLLAVLGSPRQVPQVNVFGLGTISTPEFESHFEMDVDDKTVYFVRSTPQFTDWKIWTARADGAGWTKPTMATFSGTHRDADPFITPDGKRFFFISDRPHPDKKDASMDIWVMERRGRGWSEPKRLGPDVNSETDEWYPTTTKSGTLYFGSGRKGALGQTDIWRSSLKNGRYTEAVNLGRPVNSAEDEIEPFIAPDESMLIFGAGRTGGAGGLDFYVSRRNGKGWSEPKRLPEPPNSPRTELAPKLSRDGKRFYFTGIRKGALGELLWIDVKELGLLTSR
jgi:Tol biopolymer transport system component